MGINEYLDFLGDVGAGPMICVNIATGTPEEAAGRVDQSFPPNSLAMFVAGESA